MKGGNADGEGLAFKSVNFVDSGKPFLLPRLIGSSSNARGCGYLPPRLATSTSM